MGKDSRDGESGEEGEGEKGKMCDGRVPAPHKECSHYLLQICIIKSHLFKGKKINCL